MIVVGEEKPSLEDVVEHFGVKGMHWGVRKSAPPMERHANYTERNYKQDKSQRGEKAANRINKRISEGKTLGKARMSEDRRQYLKKVAVIGATYAAVVYGPGALQLAGGALSKGLSGIAAKRGAAAAAKIFSDTNGIASHPVVHVAFNAAKNIWE